MPEFGLGVVVLGCVGGILPDILRVIKTVRSGGKVELPPWLGLILLVLLGGFAAWILEPKTAKEAVAYGFGAPELISRLASKPAAGVRGMAPAQRRSLLRWWAV